MAKTKEEQEVIENLKKEAKKIMDNFSDRVITTLTTISMYTIKNMGDGQHPGKIDRLKAYEKNPNYDNIPLRHEMLPFLYEMELLTKNYHTLTHEFREVLQEFCDLLKIKNPMEKKVE